MGRGKYERTELTTAKTRLTRAETRILKLRTQLAEAEQEKSRLEQMVYELSGEAEHQHQVQLALIASQRA